MCVSLICLPSSAPQIRQAAVRSDTNYAVAARMIELLGHAGTALVVAATRQTAQLIARVLAETGPEHPDSFALADFVKTRLDGRAGSHDTPPDEQGEP